MTFIDLFAGVGGFRRGLELAGHKCVGFCEFDKFATASYISMHLLTEEQREHLATMELKKRQKEILKDEYRNGEWYARDIRTVNAGDIPRADLWAFGFPCQDISAAGNMAGFSGNRSSLFFRVMQLVRDTAEEDRPKYLFIENVKNLLSINNGWDFAAVLYTLEECGYAAEWQVVNSKYFGVPQNRERVFIVGHIRSGSSPAVFPISGTTAKNSIEIKQIGEHNSAKRKNPNTFRTYDRDGIAPTLNTMGGGGREPCIGEPIKQINAAPRHFQEHIAGESTTVPHVSELFAIDKNAGGVETDVARCVTTRYDNGVNNHKGVHTTAVAIPVLTPDRVNKQQNGRRMKEPGNPAFTLTAEDRHGVAIEAEPIGGAALKIREATKQGYAVAHEGDAINLSQPNSKTRRVRVGAGIANTLDTSCNQGVPVIWYEKRQCYIAIRKLTPRECWRLQGWSDEYFRRAQFVNSDSQLYKQAGNGVTVTVIQAIAERLEE